MASPSGRMFSQWTRFHFIPRWKSFRYGPGPPQRPLTVKKNEITDNADIVLFHFLFPLVCSSPEESVPVKMRHHVGLHVVHEPAFFGLIDGERLQGLPVVVKLCQDDRVVAGHQRTRGVTVILHRRRRAVTGSRLQTQPFGERPGFSPSCLASPSSGFCWWFCSGWQTEPLRKRNRWGKLHLLG